VKKLFTWRSKPRVLSQTELKDKTYILFVDDEQFDYIERIRAAGWNAHQVTDIENLDDEHLKRTHIVFLDYVGVGKKLAPNQQGIGLLKAIKQKYPQKIVIFYSGHAGFTLGHEFRAADDWMPKNADPYVFLQKIEENAQKVNFG
jgi:DNA-binding NtrC family response regulator